MKIDVNTLKNIISKMPKINITVIGDVILDKYIFGKVRRISPEAPVPVVEVTKEKISLGGAANVANNIFSLNAKVRLVSVIGNDTAGNVLRDILDGMKGINTDFMIVDSNHKTSEKTRIIAEHQQVVRFDQEKKLDYTHQIKEKMKENISKTTDMSDAVILSDYGKGVLSKEIIKFTVEMCKKKNIPVFVDPKIEHFFAYKDVTSMTPNTQEAFGGMRKNEDRKQDSIEKIGVEIVKKLSLKTLIITQSEDGMTVFKRDGNKIKSLHIPTAAKEVYDVTGAGDTVISVACLVYAITNDIFISAAVANIAAGIVVSKLGAAVVSPQELLDAIR